MKKKVISRSALTLSALSLATLVAISPNTMAASHAASSNKTKEGDMMPMWNRAGTFVVTPYVGGMVFAGKRELNDVAMPAVGLGYNFTPHWGAEFYVGGFNTDSNGSLKEDVNGQIYTFNGRYTFFPEKKLQPYLLAGAGLTHISPNGTIDAAHRNGNADSVDAVINGGAGVQYFVGKYVSLRVDARDVYTPHGGKNDGLFNLGVNFYLGGSGHATKSGLPGGMQACLGKQADVHFPNDSAVVNPKDKTQIAHVAKCMNTYPTLRAKIGGHTSSTGTPIYNMALSKRRAYAVKSELVKDYGVSSSRLSTKGFGLQSPLASNKSESGRAQNRRVETIILTAPQQ